MWFLKLLLLLLVAIPLQRFCHRETDGFAFRKITSTLSFNPEWEIPPPDPQTLTEIKQALSQPFHYLSKGAQSYVFASSDGNYVLKFFRHDHMRPEPWHYLLSADHRKERGKLAESKLLKDFKSYTIAFEKLKDSTGLVYLHLNKTQELNIETPLYDKIGVLHKTQLDQMEFLLQKRATPFFPTLEKWVNTGEVGTAKQALTHLVYLLKGRLKGGIFDKDPDLNSNFGFLEGVPLQIDVGRFKIDRFYQNPQVYKREVARITDNLHQWLEAHSPELCQHLKEEIQQL